MRKVFTTALIAGALASMLTVGVQAADYSFETDPASDFYPATSYEEVYGSLYNYAGPNRVDYELPQLPYGTFSTTQTGVMEKAVLPGLQETVGSAYGSTGAPGMIPIPPVTSTPEPSPVLPPVTAFTVLTDDFKLSNGAVGRISIPALGISRYYLWEGETSSSMNKGVAHFSDTSVWDGNVGLCGHNRGSSYNIGGIKDLDIGDKLTYTTSLGTRTYKVQAIVKIRNDDWRYLGQTTDNRITLITCVAGDSSHRWCVQAIETK